MDFTNAQWAILEPLFRPQRRRRKWPPPVDLLRLAAYQNCLIAALLLDRADYL